MPRRRVRALSIVDTMDGRSFAAAHRRDRPRVQIPDLRRRVRASTLRANERNDCWSLGTSLFLSVVDAPIDGLSSAPTSFESCWSCVWYSRLGQRLAVASSFPPPPQPPRRASATERERRPSALCERTADGLLHAARRSCSSSADRLEAERLDAPAPCRRRCRRAVEHRELVARDRRARQALGSAAPGAHERRSGRGACAPALAERARDPLVQLVPGRRVGAAELERAVRRRRRSIDLAKNAATSSTQIGWSRRVAAADDRRHRRPAHLADEERQHAAVAAEDEARPEDHVLEPGRARRPAPSPTSRGSTARASSSPRSTPRRSSARTGATPAASRRRDEVARPCVHHPLEVRRAAGDDRDEVDDRVAALDGARAGSSASVTSPCDELAAPGLQRRRRAPGSRTRQRTSRSCGAQRVHDPRADEPGAAGDEDHRRAKFCQ